MKNYTYNFEVSTLIAQFMGAFNEVVIKRYDRTNSHKTPVQKGEDISPTFLYSPKQRVIHDFTNNQAKLRLPICCFSISGFSRDQNRVFNKIEGPSFTADQRTNHLEPGQPLPIDLEISMTILSRYQEDMDQLISNFAPYCDPYIAVSWPDPYNPEEEIRTIIEWSGNANISYPTDIKYNDNFIITADTTFTIKGWLFKASNEFAGGIIHNIDSRFYAVSDIYCDYSANVANQQPENTDFIYISGQPTITDVYPYVYPNETPLTISVVGTNFNFTTAYYLSGDMFNDTFFDFTSSQYTSGYFDYVPAVSGIGFYGTQITPNILSPNVFQFTPPSVSAVGLFDIIAINDAGVGYLTQDSLFYPLTADGYTPWQKPCINGVEIVNSY